ncbi:MAG: glucose-1-phosphate adenylyltransferase, partial [Sporomusa sp.]
MIFIKRGIRMHTSVLSNARSTMAMVLAGGKGERLHPITLNRPKPYVSFGGKYKIIDFVLSNLFNSGIKKVFVLTQYQAYPLNKHIKESWSKWVGLGEFYDTISPETNNESEEWFKGTADAIFQFMSILEATDAEYIAIFGGDHIYKMDVSQMISDHILNQADITVALLEIPSEEAKRFGICSVDENSRVYDFLEKPESPQTIPYRSTCFASMGNYIFSRNKLIEVLKKGRQRHVDLDFGKHIIPMMLEDGDRVFAYNFIDNIIPGNETCDKGYWKNVGTVDSYYNANMDLINFKPQFNLYNYCWPIITNQGNFPPATTVFEEDGRRGQSFNTFLCGGCIIRGSTVHRSIVGPCCQVNSYSLVEDSILFDNVKVGKNVQIKRAIIDENISIPNNTQIGYDHEADRQRGCLVTE